MSPTSRPPSPVGTRLVGAPLAPADLAVQLHRIASELSHVLDDDAVHAAQHATVMGRSADAARILAFAVDRTCLRGGGTPALAALDECLVELGLEPLDQPADATPADDAPRIPVWVVAGEYEGEPNEPVDDWIRDRVTEVDGVYGAWRAWRIPDMTAPNPPVRPLVVFEVRDPAAHRALASRLYASPTPRDDDSPAREPLLPEVYLAGHEASPTGMLAQESGDVVHVGVAVPRHRLALLSDGVEPQDGVEPSGGGGADPVTLSRSEAGRLLQRLRAGHDLLRFQGRDHDRSASADRRTEPWHFRTDGVWIWSTGWEDRLEDHRLAPPPAFLEYLRVGPAPGPCYDIHRSVARDRLVHELQRLGR